MKILHVVTLLDPDGSFGGPVRVAVNLAHELTRRGQQVTIAAGQQGFPAILHRFEGVEAVTAPAHPLLSGAGFSGLVSPRLLVRLMRRLRTVDVVHVHLSRDLITMPTALLALAMRVPLVVQTHGMIDRSSRALARPMDSIATRRVLRGAGAVLYLTEAERAEVCDVARTDLRTTRLPNGVPQSTLPRTADDNTVIFASRLQARKRPTVFVAAAAEVIRTHPSAQFVIAGPDEGELPAVVELISRLGLTGNVSYVGALSHDDLLDRLRSAALYVLPSVDEPYPMTVLEAMSVGTPVIISTSCGLADDVRRIGAGTVVEPSIPEVARAISTMLADGGGRSNAGRLAAASAGTTFGIAAVADDLMEVYRRVVKVGS